MWKGLCDAALLPSSEKVYFLKSPFYVQKQILWKN